MTRNPNKSTAEELEEVERQIAAEYAIAGLWGLPRPPAGFTGIHDLEARAKSLRSDYARKGW